jgi:hypothetical protein
MKISHRQLRRIIKEELSRALLREQDGGDLEKVDDFEGLDDGEDYSLQGGPSKMTLMKGEEDAGYVIELQNNMRGEGFFYVHVVGGVPSIVGDKQYPPLTDDEPDRYPTYEDIGMTVDTIKDWPNTKAIMKKKV